MRKLHHYLPFLILITTVPTLPADSGPAIEGIVLDPSGRAVRGASVQCNGAAGISAIDGRFRFPGIERCEAEVSSPGFETRKLELAAGSPVRVELALAGVTERVVVTATRTQATVEEAGVAAEVVTRTDIVAAQFPGVADLLRGVPGLHVMRSGRPGSLTSIYTRGSQRTGTMVLLDGVPVNDPGGEIDFAHLDSGSIGRIEVVRGPESALFGAEAASGVVQLFTRRGDPERVTPRGSLSYERGNFKTDRWIANLSGGSGRRLDYALGAEQFHSAGEFPNDAYRNTTGTANIGLRLSSSTELRGIVQSFDSFLGVPGQVGYGLYDFDARQANRASTLALHLDDMRGAHYFQRFSFGYNRLRDVYTDTQTDGPYRVAALVRDVPGAAPRTYRLGLIDPKRLPLPASEMPAGARVVQQDVLLWAMTDPYVDATSRKRFDYQGTLTHAAGSAVFGYDYERQEGDISANSAARNNHGLFLHKQQTLAGRVYLAGGVRLERSSVFGSKLTPRGAVSFLAAGEHGPLSSTFLRVSAGRGITEPSLLQNFAREAWYVGNPDLKPEKTSSYEAGLVQEWFSRRLRTEASVFHNSFQDLIVFVSLPPPVWGSWRNVEASRARGLEFCARTKPVKNVSFAASYTRLWSRILRSNTPASPFSGVGQELGRRPGNAGSVSLAVSPRRWHFQAGALMVGERQDTDLFGVTRNPGYQNVYAGGSFRANAWLTPFLRADNLLNSRYEEVLGYSSLSRSVRGGLRVEW